MYVLLFFSFVNSYRAPLILHPKKFVDKNLFRFKTNQYSANNKVSAIQYSVEKGDKRVDVFIYLTLWYVLSMVYNISNKKALQLLRLPWFVATLQMCMGLLIFIPLWILKIRELPANTIEEWNDLISHLKSVAWYQTLTHISGVTALGAGSVSFIQVIKASEPAFTAFISAAFEREYFPVYVYLTLVPVIMGVAMASVTEINFTWYCFIAGVLANIFAAARGVFAKKQMCGDTKCVEAISPENYYALLTILSATILIPFTVCIEGKQILQLYSLLTITNENAITSSISGLRLNALLGLKEGLLSGILFYLYNEVSFKALNNVHPITHALSNTVKRIFIILSSVFVFQNPISRTGIFGTILATTGVFLYSLAQFHYKQSSRKENKINVK